MLAERMTLENIEAKNNAAYDLVVKFDAFYHECQRRFMHGLNLNYIEPEEEPCPADVAKCMLPFGNLAMNVIYFTIFMCISKWA
jgi:hypothetical protein